MINKNKLNENLCLAASKGDHIEVLLLLKEGANPDLRNSEGYFPLHLAIESGNKESVKVLLRTADLTVKSPEGWTPFLMTCAYGLYDLIDLFPETCFQDLEANGDNALAMTLLHAKFDDPLFHKALTYLLERIDLNHKNNNGENLLMIAASSGNIETFKRILPNFDPNKSSRNGLNALMIAIISSHPDIVRELLPITDLNHVCKKKKTALKWAVKSSSETIIEMVQIFEKVQVERDSLQKEASRVFKTNARKII